MEISVGLSSATPVVESCKNGGKATVSRRKGRRSLPRCRFLGSGMKPIGSGARNKSDASCRTSGSRIHAQFSDDVEIDFHEAEKLIIHLRDEFLPVSSFSGFTDQPNSDDAIWVLAFILAGIYLTSPPGGMQGLVDYIRSPMYKMTRKKFPASAVKLGRQLGEGSFGIVYEGHVLSGPDGSKEDRVILKRVKARVEAAEEMREVELYMNYRLQRCAPKSCADFLGTMEVSEDEAHGKLKEGLWMVWKYQGEHTLAYFMKQNSFPSNLVPYLMPDLEESGGDLEQNGARQHQEGLLIRETVRQLLKCLKGLHRTGIIHRDIKPANIIVSEDNPKSALRLVDLGACVDLRTGFNFVPNETVMDPKYAAPEKFVMPPKTTPPLPPDPISSLLSPFVWALNTPDRFDLYAVGVILMQLSVKQLRTESGLENFNQELKKRNHDLDKWRKRCHIAESEFSLLDADDGAGWELARALLLPRPDAKLSVWPGLGIGRPSAAAALRFRFFTGHLPEPSTSKAAGKSDKARVKTPKPDKQPKGPPVPRQGQLSPYPGLAMAPTNLMWYIGAHMATANDHIHNMLGNSQEPSLNVAPSGPYSPLPHPSWRESKEVKPKGPFSPWPQGPFSILPLVSAMAAKIEVQESSQDGKGSSGVGNGSGGESTSRPQVVWFSKWPRLEAPEVAAEEVGEKRGQPGLSSNPITREFTASVLSNFVTLMEVAPQAAIGVVFLLAVYESCLILQSTVAAAHDLGRAAAENLSLPLIAAGGIAALVVVMMSDSSEGASSKKAAIKGVNPSQEGGPEEVPIATETSGVLFQESLVYSTPPAVESASNLVESVRLMEQQMGSIEQSIICGEKLSSQQQDLIQRVESLLLSPMACPWPREENSLMR